MASPSRSLSRSSSRRSASLAALLLLSLAHARAPPHRMSLVNLAALRVEPSAAADDYSVSASPSAGLADGDWVAVRFSSSAPSPTDLVLAYAPLPANLSASSPVEWFLAASADAGYLTTGTGVLPARLVNMRAPYTFVLASGSPAAPVVRAVSGAVTFANANEPRGARLALTGAPTEMRVSWSSASAAFGPTVELTGPAASPSAAATVVPASSSITWAAADLCGPPATTVGWHDPGFVHSAVLSALEPGEIYTYTVGDSTGRSQHYSFRQPSATAFPFSISVVGDMGSDSLDHSSVQRAFPPAPNTTRLMAADVASGLSQAVLHVGDLAYAMGQEASWDYFVDVISTANVIAPRVPYLVNQVRSEARCPALRRSAPGLNPHRLSSFPLPLSSRGTTRPTTPRAGPRTSRRGPAGATAAASAACRRPTSSPCRARSATPRTSGGAPRSGRSSRCTSRASSTRRPAARCTPSCETHSPASTAPSRRG